MNIKHRTLLVAASIAVVSCNQNTKIDSKENVEITQVSGTKESLSNVLEDKKKAFLVKADSTKISAYEKGILDVKNSGVLEKALKKGDSAPNFTLKNATGEDISLYKMLEKGPVVLTWYRGGWCPYCNLTLRYLQEELPNFKKYGAQLVALSPEIPDQSLNTQEKNKLKFEVLSDIDNQVGLEYGVVYDLPAEIAKRYEVGFGLSEYNGNNKAQLPLSATYIINTDKTITYSYLNADYRERAEPQDLIEVLKRLN